MIRYSLVCARKHNFESWFPSAAAYDSQVKHGLVECPICGSDDVEKAIMAPQVKRRDRAAASAPEPVPEKVATPPAAPVPDVRAPVAMMSPQEHEFRTKLKELREHVMRNADYVGQRFPDEARKMHHGEIEHRSIYGEASAQEAKELSDEGIEFHPLPILPDDHN